MEGLLKARVYEHGDRGPGIQVLGLSFSPPLSAVFPDGADTPFLSGSDHTRVGLSTSSQMTYVMWHSVNSYAGKAWTFEKRLGVFCRMSFDDGVLSTTRVWSEPDKNGVSAPSGKLL